MLVGVGGRVHVVAKDKDCGRGISQGAEFKEDNVVFAIEKY